ncbi:MAG: hypothetical protein OXQ29_08295, partial [Rhodospirillaceae bacterium]|nr:hypothetical protein [Rhodospirillaceae bacterium]
MRHVVAKGRILGGANANARAGHHAWRIACRPMMKMETLAIAQIHAVVAHVDVERLAKLRRSIGQLHIRQTAPAIAHNVNAGDRCYRPDEYAPRHAYRLGDHVQASVLASPKDVCASGGTEQHLGTPGSAPKGMGRWVSLRQIGLGLDDAPGDEPVDQRRSEQLARDFSRVPTEECPVHLDGVRVQSLGRALL